MKALVYLGPNQKTAMECGVLNSKVAPGSTVATVGCGPIGLAALLTAQFYSPAEIIMIDLDDGRLVDTVSTPMLLKTLCSAHRPHGLDPRPLITHRFKLAQILDAYETFAHAAETHALKVLIEA